MALFTHPNLSADYAGAGPARMIMLSDRGLIGRVNWREGYCFDEYMTMRDMLPLSTSIASEACPGASDSDRFEGSGPSSKPFQTK
jgi:hypothetical protein